MWLESSVVYIVYYSCNSVTSVHMILSIKACQCAHSNTRTVCQRASALMGLETKQMWEEEPEERGPVHMLIFSDAAVLSGTVTSTSVCAVHLGKD